MKSALLLAVVLACAGCGGKHTTHPANTASAPVTKVLRGVDIVFKGGTANFGEIGNKQTSVSVQLDKTPAKGTTAELDKGSCVAPHGLRLAKPLGAVTSRTQSWSVVEPLSRLTSSPLALVLRSKAGRVVACAQAHSG
jgi:hypothetical protein